MDPRANRLRMAAGLLRFLSFVFCLYNLGQRRAGRLVDQLGKSSGVLTEPLASEVALAAQKAVSVDLRRRSVQTQNGNVDQRQENVVLLSYIIWSVEEPLQFYQAIGNDCADENSMD